MKGHIEETQGQLFDYFGKPRYVLNNISYITPARMTMENKIDSRKTNQSNYNKSVNIIINYWKEELKSRYPL